LHVRNKASNGLELYITDDKNDSYLKRFIKLVHLDKRTNSQLIDDPYTEDKLNALNFKYAILWLKDDEPFYGHFAIQYDVLPSTVIRMYSRMYKLSTSEVVTNLRFLKEEHRMYSIYLKELFDIDGVTTIFWARHSEKTDQKDMWKHNGPFKKIILGDKIKDLYKFKTRLKGIEQSVVYFNAWDIEEEVNHNFVYQLDKL
jgi:hypothetical protein